MKIYLGNLSYNVDEENVREIFEEVGQVSSVTIIKDKFTGKSRGFAFIEMPNEEEAQEAIKKFDGGKLDGKKIIVNEARPKDDNNNNNRNSGGRGGDYKKKFNNKF